MKIKGFTLMEILIVLIILGVLAGLAVPILTKVVDRAEIAEALESIRLTRHALARYYAENQTYGGVVLENLDYDPNLPVGGQVLLFDYSLMMIGIDGQAVFYAINATNKTNLDDAISFQFNYGNSTKIVYTGKYAN